MAKNELKCQIVKNSVLLYEIDVVENNGDNRFQTGSKDNE